MKRTARWVLLAFLSAGLATTIASAQGNDVSDLRKHPGWADFDGLYDRIDVEPNIEVFLRGSLLRLVAEASRVEDDELADMLLRLKSVRVIGYDLGEDSKEGLIQEIKDIMRGLSKDLRKSAWQRVALVREDEEEVHFFVREDGVALQGLTVMVIDSDDEAVFVNIVGEIDPDQIGRLGRKFNIDVLEDSPLGG